MTPIKETFRDTTYHLAKALHFSNVSKEYFELLRVGTSGETKNIFNNCIQRIEWVYKNIYDRLSSESKEALKKEMEDSLAMDAIIDGLIKLDPDKRTLVETIINQLAKGENIEFVQENNY